MAIEVIRNRTNVSAQHTRWLIGAILIDGYLYVKPGRIFYLLEVRLKSRDVKPSAQVMYSVEPDAFGLFGAVKLQTAPRVLGVSTRVDNLNAMTRMQRKALRELLRALATDLREALWSADNCKFSTCLHCLQPVPLDPLDGIVNHYAGSGRASRDMELAKRALEKRLTKPNTP